MLIGEERMERNSTQKLDKCQTNLPFDSSFFCYVSIFSFFIYHSMLSTCPFYGKTPEGESSLVFSTVDGS